MRNIDERCNEYCSTYQMEISYWRVAVKIGKGTVIWYGSELICSGAIVFGTFSIDYYFYVLFFIYWVEYSKKKSIEYEFDKKFNLIKKTVKNWPQNKWCECVITFNISNLTASLIMDGTYVPYKKFSAHFFSSRWSHLKIWPRNWINLAVSKTSCSFYQTALKRQKILHASFSYSYKADFNT